MFEDDSGVVLLGWPQAGAVGDDDPYISKGGGRAAWLPGAEPPPTSALCCAACGLQLFLVAQIYAPIDVPRALYIYGCNRASCQGVPGRYMIAPCCYSCCSCPSPSLHATIGSPRTIATPSRASNCSPARSPLPSLVAAHAAGACSATILRRSMRLRSQAPAWSQRWHHNRSPRPPHPLQRTSLPPLPPPRDGTRATGPMTTTRVQTGAWARRQQPRQRPMSTWTP